MHADTPAIVIVEDESYQLRLLQRLISALAPDHAIFPVDTAADALAIVQTRPVQLLITDQILPDMPGLELAAEAKAASPETTIMMITGVLSRELEHAARGAGVDIYLAKPFRITCVEGLVRAVCERDVVGNAFSVAPQGGG